MIHNHTIRIMNTLWSVSSKEFDNGLEQRKCYNQTCNTDKGFRQLLINGKGLHRHSYHTSLLLTSTGKEFLPKPLLQYTCITHHTSSLSFHMFSMSFDKPLFNMDRRMEGLAVFTKTSVLAENDNSSIEHNISFDRSMPTFAYLLSATS